MARQEKSVDEIVNEFKGMLEDHNDSVHKAIEQAAKRTDARISEVKKDMHGRMDRLEASLSQSGISFGELKGRVDSLANQTKDQWDDIGKLKKASDNTPAPLIPAPAPDSKIAAILSSPGFKWVGIALVLIIIGLFGWRVQDVAAAIFK